MDLPAAPPLLTRVRTGWWQSADRATAVLYGAVAGLLLAKHADDALPLLAALAGAVAVAWPIAARSRRPVAAFLVSLAALGAVAAWQPRSAAAGLVPLGLTLYTLASRARLSGTVAALCTALAAAATTALPDFRHAGGMVVFGSLYLVLWTIGFAVGMHRRYTALALHTQAEMANTQVERARQELVRQRMDVARELHDVLAHHMSVITVQAGYGGLLLEDGGAAPGETASDTVLARGALAVIENTGRQVLEEMRRMVEVLQTEPEDPADAAPEHVPAPGMGDLPRLIELAAHAGVRVAVTTAGVERALPPGEDLAAYRIVQEALTNVSKHGGCDEAALRLHFGGEHLEIQVINGAARSGLGLTRDAVRSPGRGTTGMRERAALYGGELQAGPTGEGGYHVRARLPLPPILSSAAASTAPAGQSSDPGPDPDPDPDEGAR